MTIRITPAGAGKTRTKRTYRPDKTDHPRRCGENIHGGLPSSRLRGSPPQVRGKHDRHVKRLLIVRITPAGAGKTNTAPGEGSVVTDHPRRCGENRRSNSPDIPKSGSPPQVRGKLLVVPILLLAVGITPAGAGKTRSRCCPQQTLRDHPRRCGENIHFGFEHARTSGSPPQVRGKPMRNNRKKHACRITPAGAGKTRRLSSNPRCNGDHPRRCGENFF